MGDNRGGESRGELVIYQTEYSSTRVQVRLVDESVWMTQAAMAELFQTTPQNITIHLKAIFEEGELDEAATCRNYLQVQIEGNRAHPMSTPFPATKPSPLGRGRGKAGVRGVEGRHV